MRVRDYFYISMAFLGASMSDYVISTTLPEKPPIEQAYSKYSQYAIVVVDMQRGWEANKNYSVMGSIKQFETILQFALPQFLKKIERLNIKERILCDKQENVLKIKTGKYKYLKSEYLFPSSFWIYGDKVAIFVWNLPYFVIVVNNKEVAQTYQNYFEFFWSLAGR